MIGFETQSVDGRELLEDFLQVLDINPRFAIGLPLKEHLSSAFFNWHSIVFWMHSLRLATIRAWLEEKKTEVS